VQGLLSTAANNQPPAVLLRSISVKTSWKCVKEINKD